ncbi:hypothetical protein Y032_0148g2627 [Ancylostoma ceylanicum]|uniref:Uncharacterized protein n=1 Tax=Ancylostoma ceylanicum TaxID=53326 RepID=A0A016T1R5_9BILA|nr:hypothetical protein Y032_0148g2627 [Ancylostoma ceylanicum]
MSLYILDKRCGLPLSSLSDIDWKRHRLLDNSVNGPSITNFNHPTQMDSRLTTPLSVNHPCTILNRPSALPRRTSHDDAEEVVQRGRADERYPVMQE